MAKGKKPMSPELKRFLKKHGRFPKKGELTRSRSMAKGKTGNKGKRTGRYAKYHRAAKKTVGRMLKAVVVLGLPVVVAYGEYKRQRIDFGNKIGVSLAQGTAKFASCFTGYDVDQNWKPVWTAENLAYGWGPPLLYTGMNFVFKTVPGGQGAHPFRVATQAFG